MDVVDNRARERFELGADGHRAFAHYHREDGRIIFTHTLVPPELEGRGIGSRLIAAALAQVRAEGLKVVPQCPFVRAYIDKHSEERDLLA
jgi:predicted GNAT family acetyltransferase